MKMTEKNPIPQEVVFVVETLEKGGFEAYLVGGCVRDILLGRNPKDWDVTTNAHPEQIQALFPKTVYENTYGTVAVINEETSIESLKNIEVTPYRLESGYSDKRHPDEVRFSKNLNDDLQRRDFTINAIAASLSKGSIKDIVDPYDGFKDILTKKPLRTVGNALERFNEDALRMIRAIRLVCELDLPGWDKSLIEAIKKLNFHVKEVSIERIRDEFSKILLSPNPKKGLESLQEFGILKRFIPELEKGIGVTQNQAHKFDVWEHLLRSLQHAADKDWPLDIRLAALFHDIAKPQTKGVSRETGIITFYGHEVIGSRETKKILERMKFSRVTIDKVTKLVRWHMFFSDTEQINLSAVRRMIVNVGQENIWDLMNLRICDRIGTGRPKEDPYRLRKYKAMVEEALRDPISLSMLKINGKQVTDFCKIQPGPKIGYILHALFDKVLDNPNLNNEETLKNMAVDLCKLPDSDLKSLGQAGILRKEKEDQNDVTSIRKRYHVS